MVRRSMAVLVVTAVLCMSAAAATPEASLELGLNAFRAGDYASARVDLEAAAASTVNAADLQTALVYLALTQFRLGGEDDARATILRQIEAERLSPVYATLALPAGVASEFETLVAALVPQTAPPPPSDSALPLPPVKPIVPREPEVAAPLPTRPAAVALDSATVKNALNSLRQAEALADQGELAEAEEIYKRLAATEPREIVAAAAVGLYRTGAYREAVQAFHRLGALGRGEEDLHYYFAVSLYEAGDYETARRELMCALPYIELTEEVARYRIKIEQALISRS